MADQDSDSDIKGVFEGPMKESEDIKKKTKQHR